MNKPEIKIVPNRFLTPIFAEYAKTNSKWVPMSLEEVNFKVEIYKNLWELEEEKILKGLTEALGLHFLENLIRVYIVSGQRGGFSDPIIISSDIDEKKFVDVLTHELIHRLITFNAEKIDTNSISKKLFGEIKDPMTSSHIMINSVEKYIYLNVLNDESRLKRNIDFLAPYPALMKSWEIVEERGYKELLNEYRSHY